MASTKQVAYIMALVTKLGDKNYVEAKIAALSIQDASGMIDHLKKRIAKEATAKALEARHDAEDANDEQAVLIAAILKIQAEAAHFHGVDENHAEAEMVNEEYLAGEAGDLTAKYGAGTAVVWLRQERYVALQLLEAVQHGAGGHELRDLRKLLHSDETVAEIIANDGDAYAA
jgi:hypothetical protein